MVFSSTTYGEEKNTFYDSHAKDLTLWQCLLLSLWSQCVFVHKLYEILQIVTISRATQSLKKFRILLLTTLKLEELSFWFFFHSSNSKIYSPCLGSTPKGVLTFFLVFFSQFKLQNIYRPCLGSTPKRVLTENTSKMSKSQVDQESLLNKNSSYLLMIVSLVPKECSSS